MKKQMMLNVLLLLAICLISASYLTIAPWYAKVGCALLGGVCIGVYHIIVIELIKKGGDECG